MTELRSHVSLTASNLEALVNERARRLGKTVAELQEHDKELLRTTDFKRKECLDPFEIEMFFSGELRPERVSHVAECSACAALINVTHPSERSMAVFAQACQKVAEAIEAKAVESEQARLNDSRDAFPSRPVKDAISVEVPALLILVLASAAFIAWSEDDYVMRKLISLSTVKYAVFTALSMILSVGAAVLIGQGLQKMAVSYVPKFNHHGGAVIGGLCASVMFIVIGKGALDVSGNYKSIKMSESMMLGLLADADQYKYSSVKVMNASLADQLGVQFALSKDSSHISAAPINQDWKLDTQNKDDTTNIIWSVGNDSKALGSVRAGILQKDKDGRVQILVDKQSIDVEAGLVGGISNGARVLAYVPSTASKPSQVVPMDPSTTVTKFGYSE